jgi:hypothetical protein
MDGWSAALEMIHAEAAISPMPLPTVAEPSNAASAIQPPKGAASQSNWMIVDWGSLIAD